MNYDELDLANAEKLVSQRQFFHRRIKKSSEVIAQLMARKGYNQQQSANEIADVWNRIAGEKLAQQTIVGNIRRGVLEINVANSMLIQRLEFDKKKLLAELKQQLPQTKLTNLRFRLGIVTRP